MKKLILSAAVVCAALVSQAMSASWSSGDTYFNGKGSQLSDTSGGTYSGTGYLFLLSLDQYNTFKTAASIWSAFDKNDTLTIGSSSVKVASKVVLDDGYADWLQKGSYSEGDKAYAAIIMTHENDKGVVDYYSANTMFGTAGATYVTGTDTAALGWGDAAGGAATTWQAVPEPFSGSLALLGVGLVALRRRMKKQKKA